MWTCETHDWKTLNFQVNGDHFVPKQLPINCEVNCFELLLLVASVGIMSNLFCYCSIATVAVFGKLTSYPPQCLGSLAEVIFCDYFVVHRRPLTSWFTRFTSLKRPWCRGSVSRCWLVGPQTWPGHPHGWCSSTYCYTKCVNMSMYVTCWCNTGTDSMHSIRISYYVYFALYPYLG